MKARMIILIILLNSIHSTVSVAQQPIVLPLTIGDTIPDVVFENLSNCPVPGARISDFKGQLLIFDFWSTGCSSCLAAFPKMEEIQRQFQGKVQVFLINPWETSAKIEHRIKAMKMYKPGVGLSSLPTVNGDSTWRKLFPHRTVPHHVWVDGQRKIIAITDGYNTTAANLSRFLSGETLRLKQKREIMDFNFKKPLFTREELPDEQVNNYALLIKGAVDIGRSGNEYRRKDGVLHGRALLNVDITTIFRVVGYELIPDFNDKRLVWQVADTSKLRFQGSKEDFDNWSQENFYSYDLIVPVKEAGNLYKYMLQDLNRYTDYRATIENREQVCLALVRTSNKDKFKTQGGKPENTLYRDKNPGMINYPMGNLLTWMDNLKSIKPAIIDETGYKKNVDIMFSEPITSLLQLKSELNRYDLDLKIVKKDIEILKVADRL